MELHVVTTKSCWPRCCEKSAATMSGFSERDEGNELPAVALQDSPDVRAELRGRLQRLRLVENNVQAFASSIEQVSSALTGSVLDASAIGALLSSGEQGQLNIADTLVQINDFADNLQHQLTRSLEPLRDYQASIAAAARQTKVFDDESETLDSMHHKYLSLSRDATHETRAYAHGELCDRAAGVALSLFDTKAALRDSCAAQRVVPQRALCEILVAQLTYHQSCTRLLHEIMPHVNETMQAADAKMAALEEARAADVASRAAMPRPQLREGATLAEGWLFKGAFNLAVEGAGNTMGSVSNRLKPWNKRW